MKLIFLETTSSIIDAPSTSKPRLHSKPEAQIEREMNCPKDLQDYISF